MKTKNQRIQRLGLVLMLMAMPTGGPARDQPGMPMAPKEPVCGFVKNSHYLEEGKVTQGLAVDMAVVGQAKINEPVTLRFIVHEKPADLAVNNLQIEHEKFMHIIGVRDDLGEFFHIHPVKISPGVWEVTHTFTNGGNYKIWSDVRYLDSSYAFGHPMLSLSGSLGTAATNTDRPDYEVRSGYQITLKHSEPLIAGQSASLTFLVRDASGRETETEDFLGAPMHLVIVKDDLTVYLHAHPDYQRIPEPTISFSQTLSQAGSYKLFAQFRPKGTKLAPEDAILAEFRVVVREKGDAAKGTGK